MPGLQRQGLQGAKLYCPLQATEGANHLIFLTARNPSGMIIPLAESFISSKILLNVFSSRRHAITLTVLIIGKIQNLNVQQRTVSQIDYIFRG